MLKNEIKYETTEDFNKGCYEFTRMGLTFYAHHGNLTITLTGGY